MQKLWSFFGGVHPEQHKKESTVNPIGTLALPSKLILPVHQHIGNAAKVLVKVGQIVEKGEMLASPEGFISAPIHAPTSGTITEIGEVPVAHPSGLPALAITLIPDGREKWCKLETHPNYWELDRSHLRNIIREAGIVGLGGAGFPTYVKLNPGPKAKINTLILNGVECEPYITCDDLLMREKAEEIIHGARIILHALNAEACIIAIEDNKPESFESLKRAIEGEKVFKIVKVPTKYPQGSEKQLIKTLTNKEIPKHGLSRDVGVIGQNIATAHAIYNAIILGQPLISRVVTITGSAVQHPQNLNVMIGTPISSLLSYCNCNVSSINKLIMGGPMMGFAIHSEHAPIIKTTNCILTVANDSAPPVGPVMPCIRCGNCADVCPVKLLPQQLYWHANAKEFDKTQDYNLFDCIECGCCSYVCPSNLPLVQYYRYAKGEIWKQEKENEKSDIARERHEFKQFRIEREKQERANRHKKKKAELAAKKAASAATERRNEAMEKARERSKDRQQKNKPS